MEAFPIRKAFSRIGIGLVIFLIPPPFITYAIYSVIGWLAPQLLQVAWLNAMIPFISLFLVAFPLALLVLRTIPDSAGSPDGNLRLSAVQVLGVVLAGYGIMHLLRRFSDLVAALISRIAGSAPTDGTVVQAAAPGASVDVAVTLVTFVIVVFVGPIIEETLFRGVLLKKLAPYGGRVFILFSALFFGIAHKNIYQLFYALAMGLLLGTVAWLTGGIQYTRIIHILINFLGGGVQLLLQAFGTEQLMAVWDVVANVLLVGGLLWGIVWLVLHRHSIHLPPRVRELPPTHTWVLSPGMIVYWIAVVYALVTSALS